MYIINQDIVVDFYNKTRFDLNSYLNQYSDFITNHYPLIVDFYSGKSNSIDNSEIELLNSLIDTAKGLAMIISNVKSSLDSIEYWDLMEYVDELYMKLYTISKIDKFLRSSISSGNYSLKMNVPYTMKQFQTVEDIEYEINSDEKYQDSWVETAIQNNLSELDYDTKGGKVLNIMVDLAAKNLSITGVVDNLIGEQCLGLDIKKSITFINDDIQTLDYIGTAQQSVFILTGLRKGQIPEFMDLGMSNYVGSNVATFAFPMILREIKTTFSSDDTLLFLKTTRMNKTVDSVNIDFEVSTKIGIIVKQTFVI